MNWKSIFTDGRWPSRLSLKRHKRDTPTIEIAPSIGIVPSIEVADDRSSISPAAERMTAGDLLLEFESLGDNCELGLVQRYCGVDPLGLFRFSFSRIASVHAVLGNRFADYGGDDDLEVSINAGDQEFMCHSRRYNDFSRHTETYASKTSIEKVRARELKTIVYLKERMLNELASGEKIFVRKRNDRESLADIQSLADALRQAGPNILLWIVESGETYRDSEKPIPDAVRDRPAGHVEVVGDGLLKAYISRFAPYGHAHDIDIECWLTICRRAHHLTRRMKGFTGHMPDIVPNPVIAEGDDWAPQSSRLESGQVDGPRPIGDHRVWRVTALDDSVDDTWLASKSFHGISEPPGALAFSTWIWIPSTFKGTMVGIIFVGLPVHFVGWADMSRRDVWQHVWCSTKGARNADDVSGIIRCRGQAGDTIYCSAWRLENGFVPNATSIPLDGDWKVHDRPA